MRRSRPLLRPFVPLSPSHTPLPASLFPFPCSPAYTSSFSFLRSPQTSNYAFTHYLLLSKLYLAPNFTVQNASSSSKNKKKKANKAKPKAAADVMEVDGEDALLVGNDGGPLPFHPEDSLLARVSTTSPPPPVLSVFAVALGRPTQSRCRAAC